jgi:hypothetical protein
MRAVLSTLTFDLQGFVELDCLSGQTLGETRRRMNRVATLDGGAVFNDAGFSEADRSIELRWVPTGAEQLQTVARLVELYARVRLVTPQGVFLVAVERLTPGAEAAISLLVVERLA